MRVRTTFTRQNEEVNLGFLMVILAARRKALNWMKISGAICLESGWGSFRM